MKVFIKIFTLLSLIFVSSCSYEGMVDKWVPKKESQFAKQYLKKLQAKEFSYVKKHLNPDIEKQTTTEKIKDVAEYFPDGELLSTELIGSRIHQTNTNWRGNFTFEYKFTTGWAVANAVVNKSDDKLTVVGFNVHRTKASQQELHEFTLAGKSILQYSVLVFSVIAVLFTFLTLYFCIRTPIPKRKWLWIIFILVGVGSISINWTTAEWNFQILHFKLFSAAATTGGPFSPWIISASIPLGAIVFWLKRGKFHQPDLTSQKEN